MRRKVGLIVPALGTMVVASLLAAASSAGDKITVDPAEPTEFREWRTYLAVSFRHSEGLDIRSKSEKGKSAERVPDCADGVLPKGVRPLRFEPWHLEMRWDGPVIRDEVIVDVRRLAAGSHGYATYRKASHTCRHAMSKAAEMKVELKGGYWLNLLVRGDCATRKGLPREGAALLDVLEKRIGSLPDEVLYSPCGSVDIEFRTVAWVRAKAGS